MAALGRATHNRTMPPASPLPALQLAIAHAIRAKVAGEDAPEREQRIWGEPGEVAVELPHRRLTAGDGAEQAGLMRGRSGGRCCAHCSPLNWSVA